MKTVIQRVEKASVKTKDIIRGEIKKGLLILLGIENTDSQEDIDWLSAKIIHLRIFNDEKNLMNLSVKEINGEVLLISQFTLHAKTKKGNRPSFIQAARSETAIPIYNSFIKALETQLGKTIETGEFGADMKVNLINDGPVTIVIDSKNRD